MDALRALLANPLPLEAGQAGEPGIQDDAHDNVVLEANLREEPYANLNRVVNDQDDLDEQWRAALEEINEESSGDEEEGKPPTGMELTTEERKWALDLKMAVEDSADLDNMSDFMYAQIALTDQGNLEQALQRCQFIQAIREEFDILDTFEDARQTLSRFVRLHPGHILQSALGPKGDRYVLACDLAKIDAHAFRRSLGEMKATFAGPYYMHHSHSPDLEAVRKGFVFVMECADYKWKTPGMASFEHFRKALEEIESVYPSHLHRLHFRNTGVFVNLMVSMVRRFIPKDIHKKLIVTSNSETPLNHLFMVPNVETATERLMKDMTETLRLRYENEKTFLLFAEM